MNSRFSNVSCSQCGQEFGPGDHGYSHCSDHLMHKVDLAIVSLLPPAMGQSYAEQRREQKLREAEALAEKNVECAKAIESLAQAIQSKYCRIDIEAAMQAVSKAYTAALVVDPKDAA
jgi:hypothetical protein